jgi:Family of unknown function (DUF5991)
MQKNMQFTERTIKLPSALAFSFYCMLSFSCAHAQTVAGSAKTGWEGIYSYLHQSGNSSNGANSITEYTIKLSSTSAQPCLISITNAQQDIEIACTARVEDANLTLLYKEPPSASTAAKSYAQAYKNGAPLIRFSKNAQGQLITTWLQLMPKDSAPRPPGKYFTQTLKQ